MIRSVKNFLRDEEGAVAIEYALVAAGIAGIVYLVRPEQLPHAAASAI